MNLRNLLASLMVCSGGVFAAEPISKDIAVNAAVPATEFQFQPGWGSTPLSIVWNPNSVQFPPVNTTIFMKHSGGALTARTLIGKPVFKDQRGRELAYAQLDLSLNNKRIPSDGSALGFLSAEDAAQGKDVPFRLRMWRSGKAPVGVFVANIGLVFEVAAP